MGPWATTIISVAAVAAIILATFAFRGFMEAVDGKDNRCVDCGRASTWPLPVGRHECWTCRHTTAARSLHLRHVLHH